MPRYTNSRCLKNVNSQVLLTLCAQRLKKHLAQSRGIINCYWRRLGVRDGWGKSGWGMLEFYWRNSLSWSQSPKSSPGLCLPFWRTWWERHNFSRPVLSSPMQWGWLMAIGKDKLIREDLPGESQGWRSLVGCRLWGRTESDTTEAI